MTFVITRKVGGRDDGRHFFVRRTSAEYDVIKRSMKSEFLVPLGWYEKREWYVGPIHSWIAAMRDPAWPSPLPTTGKGYAFWSYPVGVIAAETAVDLSPRRDRKRLKRTAEELTEQALADQVAEALVDLNRKLGYESIWNTSNHGWPTRI